jgi:hypothetical protein
MFLLGASMTLPARGQTPLNQPDRPLGTGIQRTMTLLATSTPRKRHTVRVLFYGQSITKQDWWKEVAEDLRRRFPHADLMVQNRAVGGFAMPLLPRPAEFDLFPFYPDLIIFHVYGGEPDYEAFIADIRRRTTAEIVLQSDHVTWLPTGNGNDTERMRTFEWHENHSMKWLPELAAKYGCGMVDVWKLWKQHLQENRLLAGDLLSDGVHLNARGNALMASLIKPYLRYDPKLPDKRWRNLTRTYAIGKEIAWRDGKLTLEFEGNRVEVIAAPRHGKTATAQIRIDGRKPSEFPELYVFTRPNDLPGKDWPWKVASMIRLTHAKPLVLEDWTLRLTENTEDGSRFAFEVVGSQTGPDGSGSSDRIFVSNSGRIVIQPEDWWLHNAFRITKTSFPVGTEIRWSVRPMFADTYAPPEIADSTRETVTVLASGLTNTTHTLEITAEGAGSVPIRAIRVYRPPLR